MGTCTMPSRSRTNPTTRVFSSRPGTSLLEVCTVASKSYLRQRTRNWATVLVRGGKRRWLQTFLTTASCCLQAGGHRTGDLPLVWHFWLSTSREAVATQTLCMSHSPSRVNCKFLRLHCSIFVLTCACNTTRRARLLLLTYWINLME